MEQTLHAKGSDAMSERTGLLDRPRSADESYFYVLAFDTGVVKVGVARDVLTRIGRHSATAIVHRRRLDEVWISVPHLDARNTERLAIAYCEQRATRRFSSEYFDGVTVAQVIGHVRRLPAKRAEHPAVTLSPRGNAEPPTYLPLTAQGAQTLYPIDEAARRTGLNAQWLLAVIDRGDIPVIPMKAPEDRRYWRLTAQSANTAVDLAKALQPA